MKLGSLIPWRDRSQLSIRDDVYDPFTAFRRDMDRMFDDFFTVFGAPALRSSANPTVDVTETEKDFIVTAELPGLDEKDFEVTLAGDVLTIKGEKKSAHEERNGDAYYAERRFGAFARALRLPFEVKDEKVDATYEKGVLTVRVPKPADVQHAVRRIAVKAA
jgi:HSP20 family protein